MKSNFKKHPELEDYQVAEYTIGDTLLLYFLHQTGAVEFLPVPLGKKESLVTRERTRPMHPSMDGSVHKSYNGNDRESLVQVAIRGLPYSRNWVAGHTMRCHEATRSLRFVSQDVKVTECEMRIETTLTSEHGFEVKHTVDWVEGDVGFLVDTSIFNTGDDVLELEMLSSFSLAGITPFAGDDAPNRLHMHRFRTAWSAEGRHYEQSIEGAHLERNWGALPVQHRFGQSGSLPVREYFPFLALEDRYEGVFWGAQLAWHGSWQMEIFRKDDGIAISGGQGDYERAHWMKKLNPGEMWKGPVALVATTTGGIDDICHCLVSLQDRLASDEPKQEEDLPIIFNEWCSTWGSPSHDYILRTAKRLQETDTTYLVIDDGWAEKPEGADIQFNGDWNVNEKAFPGGLSETTRAVREMGLIPGIWFEFEPCTKGTEAFDKTDHHLQRHGKTLTVGNRRFWDFRDSWTWDYLREKVIRLLKENNFGYLKVDYNECIGLGCDGAESLGEGLAQHLNQVLEFFKTIRKEVPGIVIENCSSGGHRAEPGMVGVTSMSSFSDAHETVEIPVIAANLHRLLPAKKNQVWAVIRPNDTLQRIRYSLAATFLGRMCISGDVVELDEERFSEIKKAQALYKKVVPVIRDGKTSLQRSMGESYRYPTGWQALVRHGENGQLLVVVHTFDKPPSGNINISLSNANEYRIADSYGATEDAQIDDSALILPPLPAFSGAVYLLSQP